MLENLRCEWRGDRLMLVADVGEAVVEEASERALASAIMALLAEEVSREVVRVACEHIDRDIVGGGT